MFYALRMDGSLAIRPMMGSDVDDFVREECAQGWHSTPAKLLSRLEHERAGKCVTLTAELEGECAGYVFVYPDSPWGAFGNRGLPEIVDFAVLEKFRGRGIGSALMDAAEKIAARYADTVYLGVGLHSGYGSAQRMYVKRGYIPDGSGVWYGDKVCPPYTPCENDDDLVLYFSKKLR
ncbi:MAG: GNAT family N-acetyltransferase [Clostridia bacterium]|nr:GNAT family N-acetyltransferase [Clostridia bacterium]